MKITFKKEEVAKIPSCVTAAYMLIYSVQLCSNDDIFNFHCTLVWLLHCNSKEENFSYIIMWFCYCEIIGYCLESFRNEVLVYQI